MTQISVCIDPGHKGAIAAINAQTLEVIEVTDAPVVEGMYDISEMAAVIRHISLLGVAVFTLEQAQAMPGQGVTSTFPQAEASGYGRVS